VVDPSNSTDVGVSPAGALRSFPIYYGLSVMIGVLALAAFMVGVPELCPAAAKTIDAPPAAAEHTIALAVPASAPSSE
jgi:hypothetical protein